MRRGSWRWDLGRGALVAGAVGRAADSLVSVSLGSVDLDSVVSEGVVLESEVHHLWVSGPTFSPSRRNKSSFR